MYLITLALLGFAAGLGCGEGIKRKDIADMSNGELKDYFDAIHLLNRGPKPTRWQKLTSKVNLTQKQFLPANREILYQIEKAIPRKYRNVTVPYWDCLPYRDALNKDPALSGKAFGYSAGCAGGRLDGFETSQGECIHRKEIHHFCPNYPLVEKIKTQDPFVYGKNHLPILQFLLQSIYTTQDASVAMQDPLMLSFLATMDRYFDAWLVDNNFATTIHKGYKKYPTSPILVFNKTAKKIIQLSKASCVEYLNRET